MKTTNKKIETLLSNVKDEIVIADFTEYADDDYYQKKILTRFYYLLQEFLTGNRLLDERIPKRVCAGLVTISCSIVPRRDVLNVILDESSVDAKQSLVESQCMERILSQFVKFVQEKDDLETILHRKRNEQTSCGIIFAIVDELLVEFWKNHNIDFHKELQFTEMCFDEIIGEVEDINSEEIEIFINHLRDAVSEYSILEKNSPNASREAIIFNAEYVWIPTKLFDEICNKIHMASSYRKILLKLRENGNLITDSGSLSRVIQIHKERFECYQFSRNTFTKMYF